MMKSFASPSIRQQHASFAAPPPNAPTESDLQVVRQIDHYMGQFGKMEQDAFRKEMEADFGKDWYYSAADAAPKVLTPPQATKKNYISFGSRGRRLRSDKKVKSRSSFKRGSSPFPRIISVPTDATMMIPTDTSDCPLTTLEYERKNIFYLQEENPCKATLMFSGKMMGVQDRKTHHHFHKRTATLSTVGTFSSTKYIDDDEDSAYLIKDDTAGDYDGWASVVESDISESDDDDSIDDSVVVAPAVTTPKVVANKTAPATTAGGGRAGGLAAWFFPKKKVTSPAPATMPELHSSPNHRVRQVKRDRRFRYSSLRDQAKNQV